LSSTLSNTNGIRPNTGRYATEQEALDAVVARLVEALDPQAIWLFGSRARSDHRPDSYFDLLVVAKEGQTWGEDYEKVYMASSGTGVGCVIVPCTADDFVIAQLLPTTLVSQVLVHGREVFKAEANGSVSRTGATRYLGSTEVAARHARPRRISSAAGGGKLLRAVLEHEQIVASPTHSLRQLAQLLPKDHRWRDAFDELDRISSAATRYRYPTSAGNIIDADEGLTSTDLANVEKLSREVSAWLSFRM
jgi:hypothetical protein